mgnify:CR=1 FL=1
MQDLNDLFYFARVVEAGGFAAAGRQLGIPKSRLSRRIAELEERLGTRLLQRTTRQLKLTAVGERYLHHCQAMLLEAEAAALEPGLDPSPAASLADVLELRYTLEPFIVGLVAQSANSQDVGQLRLTLMDMREALEADDSEAGVRAYIAFHEALFALTTNPIFQSVVQQTGNALKQSADMLRNSPEHLAARLKENEAVVRAIRERNSALASAQMRQHILAEGARMGIPLNIPDEHLHP